MYEAEHRPTGPVSDQLHPLVYWAITGLVSCLGLGIVGIVVTGPAGLALSALALIAFVVIALALLVQTRWSAFFARQRDSSEPASFADWASGDFETWQARLKASDAAILMLLPIAAVALAMDAFALAWHLAVQV